MLRVYRGAPRTRTAAPRVGRCDWQSTRCRARCRTCGTDRSRPDFCRPAVNKRTRSGQDRRAGAARTGVLLTASPREPRTLYSMGRRPIRWMTSRPTPATRSAADTSTRAEGPPPRLRAVRRASGFRPPPSRSAAGSPPERRVPDRHRCPLPSTLRGVPGSSLPGRPVPTLAAARQRWRNPEPPTLRRCHPEPRRTRPLRVRPALRIRPRPRLPRPTQPQPHSLAPRLGQASGRPRDAGRRPTGESRLGWQQRRAPPHRPLSHRPRRRRHLRSPLPLDSTQARTPRPQSVQAAVVPVSTDGTVATRRPASPKRRQTDRQRPGEARPAGADRSDEPAPATGTEAGRIFGRQLVVVDSRRRRERDGRRADRDEIVEQAGTHAARSDKRFGALRGRIRRPSGRRARRRAGCHGFGERRCRSYRLSDGPPPQPVPRARPRWGRQ